MTCQSARQPDVDVTAAAADGGQQIGAELRMADKRLQAMIRRCQECPGTLDDAVLAADDRDTSVEATVIRTFRLLLVRVFPDNSALRADHDVWEAFRQQRDEFTDFYRMARTALESYREVLEAYHAVKRTQAPLRPGDLERIQRDKHVHVQERDACLAALCEFQGKFSSMLAVLSPVPPAGAAAPGRLSD